MLAELHIENFAIIERVDLQLGAGLIFFTGETGAGATLDYVEINPGEWRFIFINPNDPSHKAPKAEP